MHARVCVYLSEVQMYEEGDRKCLEFCEHLRFINLKKYIESFPPRVFNLLFRDCALKLLHDYVTSLSYVFIM